MIFNSIGRYTKFHSQIKELEDEIASLNEENYKLHEQNLQ